MAFKELVFGHDPIKISLVLEKLGSVDWAHICLTVLYLNDHA